MVSQNLKNYVRTITIYLFVFATVICFLLLLNLFIIKLGSPIKNVNVAIALQNHIDNNNLSLPMPNVVVLEQSIVSPKTQFYLDNFDKPLYEFYDVLREHYIYEKDSYNCKYWSYVWTLYYKMNYKKYNWNIEYLSTDNHVFVMFSNESGYCIADGDILECMMI